MRKEKNKKKQKEACTHIAKRVGSEALSFFCESYECSKIKMEFRYDVGIARMLR